MPKRSIRQQHFLTIAAALGISTLALADPQKPAKPAANPFAEAVRTTEPLTAEAELASFRVPPGFTIQLVASEPQINKPINLAVDAKGRLWVTSTIEYPWAVKPDAPNKPRDAIKVIEVDPATGRATKVTAFADNLNIPAGVYPYKDGCIGFSIPNIYHFRDTNGDGIADERNVLYGPFDTSRDTHGMTNSFTRGYDGWLYATHGFNNQSKIAGKDGAAIEMKSGHVYRMKLDGSRVEVITRGPVNPFGLAFDSLGNLFVADCHTKPIQEILRGAWFEHFGRPHDGIGFYPKIMGHLHGSTGIGGVISIDDDRWPAEFRGNLLCGNPVTSRVNRDRIEPMGATPTLKELPDFIESADPWFRPVAFALAPDGSVYVADFYNRIIGHYEVPITHPGRDRERGRIWRIVPPRPAQNASRDWPADLSSASAQELAAALDHPNITARKLAADELVDRIGREAAEVPVYRMLERGTPRARANALWVLKRLGREVSIGEAITGEDGMDLVRIHMARVLAEPGAWAPDVRGWVQGFRDPHPLVRRCAAEAVGQHPSPEWVDDLVSLIRETPVEDTHTVYAARIALRACLANGGLAEVLKNPRGGEAMTRFIAGICVAIPSPEAASFLLEAARANRLDVGLMPEAIKHLVRHTPAENVDGLVALCRQRKPEDVDYQLSLLKSVKEGSAQRGGKVTEATREWGAAIAKAALVPPAAGKRASSQRLVAAAELARDLKLPAVAPELRGLLLDTAADAQSRTAAAEALLRIDPQHVSAVAELVADAKLATSFREALAKAVADVNSDEARQSLLMPIRNASHATSLRLAVALASRPEGARVLLDSIERKALLPRLLMEAPVKDKLAAAKIPDLDKRIAALTKDLTPASADLDKAIAVRRAQFSGARANAQRGKEVFQKNCAACHQLGGIGAIVGPQLDGLGARGLDRLLEDVIDPNRNVDPMFRYVNITLKDGETLSGLPRNEEGQTVTVIDSTGKEIIIEKDKIASRDQSKLSLMPTGFHEAIKGEEFHDLIAFLLAESTKK